MTNTSISQNKYARKQRKPATDEEMQYRRMIAEKKNEQRTPTDQKLRKPFQTHKNRKVGYGRSGPLAIPRKHRNRKIGYGGGQSAINKRRPTADVGKIVQTKNGYWIKDNMHFYDFLGTLPRTNNINIPYIRDIPSVQARFVGLPAGYVQKLYNKNIKRAKRIHAFITMTPTLAEHIKTAYNIKVPYRIFMAYPDWKSTPITKDDEIVYIDHSSSVPYGFKEHLSFLDKITKAINIPTIFSSKKFNSDAARIVEKYGYNVKTIPLNTYKCNSKYGILMNTNNFNQAGECLNRKLLKYLMYGMMPVIHKSFRESIHYVQSKNITPFVYDRTKDMNRLVKYDFDEIDRQFFSMKNRTNDLKIALHELYIEVVG